MVLQNYTDMLKVVPSSCCETCLTSDDRNLIIDTKGEGVSDAQAEVEPVLVTPQVIKAGCEVSYVSVFIVTFYKYAALPIFLIISISLCILFPTDLDIWVAPSLLMFQQMVGGCFCYPK